MNQLETYLANTQRQVAASQSTEVAGAWTAAKNGEYAKFCKELDEETAKLIADVQADAAKAVEKIKADAEAQKAAKEKAIKDKIAETLSGKYEAILSGLEELVNLAKGG